MSRDRAPDVSPVLRVATHESPRGVEAGMGISINRPVVIKAIVTESFKRLYIQDLEDAIKRTDAIQQQLISQIRRAELERTLTPQARAIRQQLELETARQDAAKAEL